MLKPLFMIKMNFIVILSKSGYQGTYKGGFSRN